VCSSAKEGTIRAGSHKLLEQAGFLPYDTDNVAGVRPPKARRRAEEARWCAARHDCRMCVARNCSPPFASALKFHAAAAR